MPLNAWALSYDRNSNIVSHSIYSGGSTPEVTSFTLVGNQRYDYDYDNNGNLTCMHDLITPESYEDYSSTLSYNLLNLPLHLTTDSDDYLDYRYLADGTKVSAIGYEDYGFKYAGPFRYRVELGDAFIESSEAAGGRIWCYDENDPDTPAPENRYFITDHLGSTRVVLKGDGTLSMKADYLPYGGLISGSGLNVAENDYLWTGKELQHQLFDSASYDSSARFLFIEGSFTSIDPLAEKYPGVSPYAYCAGDPVNCVDPDGTTVFVKDYASRRNVINTLSKVDSKHIQLTKNGMVCVDSKHISDSKAFNALKALSESDVQYFISSSLFYKTKEGVRVFKFGDAYDNGITLMPNSQVDTSPDSSVYIITNSLLDEIDQTKNLAHEAYGHAFFYDRLHNGEDVSPYHKYVSTYLGSIWDDEAGFAVAINGRTDTNTELEEYIKSVVHEVMSHFQAR